MAVLRSSGEIFWAVNKKRFGISSREGITNWNRLMVEHFSYTEDRREGVLRSFKLRRAHSATENLCGPLRLLRGSLCNKKATNTGNQSVHPWPTQQQGKYINKRFSLLLPY